MNEVSEIAPWAPKWRGQRSKAVRTLARGRFRGVFRRAEIEPSPWCSLQPPPESSFPSSYALSSDTWESRSEPSFVFRAGVPCRQTHMPQLVLPGFFLVISCPGFFSRSSSRLRRGGRSAAWRTSCPRTGGRGTRSCRPKCFGSEGERRPFEHAQRRWLHRPSWLLFGPFGCCVCPPCRYGSVYRSQLDCAAPSRRRREQKGRDLLLEVAVASVV